MPFEIKWGKDYVLFEYFGKVSSLELVNSNKLVYGDERFDNLKWELVHFDRAESVSINEKDIRLIAYMDKAAARSNPHITVAFIGQTETLEQIEAQYKNAGSPPVWPLVRFDSYEDAVSYITQESTKRIR